LERKSKNTNVERCVKERGPRAGRWKTVTLKGEANILRKKGEETLLGGG
jgi:hypothetical protein